ncbi:hypothetical protein EKG37_10685 [Robertmurraya yapensis]|uniref:Uncharacterized protein n=2 Tax=Bacillaceae TaxID=186817 RepID=A0A3S0LC58_9BACI|nr:hypothetical protein [Bacillus yapensis]RTR31955.1 hypothetical protein EKG37_10685 [Bacillus yapensis]TKS95969.1 hypothetical protein FAR12_10685 [Bacillus yapensis]
MDFLLVGIGLWGLLILGGLLFLFGLWKKSWLAHFFSGLALLVPAIILATQKGIFILFILLPFIAFGFAVSAKR